MKQQLVKTARKILPKSALGKVEDAYRRNRAKLVAARYGHPAKGLKVVAVTGTNGKTTTVSYLNEILKEAGLKTAMFSTAQIEVSGDTRPNTLNATVASTAQMQRFFAEAKKAKVDYVVMEFPSHALHQHKLAGVPVEMAVMTNLTQDHLDYHHTMEEYAAVKARLFALEPKFIVLNRDDQWFEYFDKYDATDQKITYGKHDEAEARIEEVNLFRKGTEARVTIDHQTTLDLATALPGEFNAYNMTAASAAAYLLGIDVKDIVEGVANLDGVPGRFERVIDKKDAGYDVIVDYAHTPDGLEKLLEAAKTLTKNRVILVFGACGDRDKAKRPLMGDIAARLADRIFLTDEESYNEAPEKIREQIYIGIERSQGAMKCSEIADRREAIEKALSIATKGDTVLITGLGHEVYRIIKGERVPWNDAEVVRSIAGQSRAGE